MNNNLLIYHGLSFAEVVKAGSYSKAAKNTGISKAQMSRHVKALESALGIQLLYRTTRTLTLTQQGKEFFASCEHLAEGYADAINHLKYDFADIKGTLKITAPIDFGIQFLPKIIHKFCHAHPHANIVLSLSNTYENLTEQAYDLAIRIANRLPDSNLRMRTLMQFRRIICAASDYVSDRGKPESLDDLKQHHCITSVNRNPNIVYPQWQLQINDKPINLSLEKFIEVDSLFAQLELIKSGTGIGRMPDYFIKNELERGALVELFSEANTLNTFVYLLYPNVKTLPQKTKVFIDFIINEISNFN